MKLGQILQRPQEESQDSAEHSVCKKPLQQFSFVTAEHAGPESHQLFKCICRVLRKQPYTNSCCTQSHKIQPSNDTENQV